MASDSDKLTFLNDEVILMIASLGLMCVTATVLWVLRQSPDWGRDNPPAREDEDGDAGLLGRTRVVPGGREAAKAARKEAKKRAKAEFKQSSAGQKRQNKRPAKQQERSHAEKERTQEAALKEKSAEDLRRLESYVLEHKVSSLADLESELSMPSEEVGAKIEELETRGAFTGIMVDDTRGGTGSAFVRVSEDELRQLASSINERGRLTIAEVATEANRILQLTKS
ncbi:unnamed protein product, partial [Scytosiphon promiscuus]